MGANRICFLVATAILFLIGFDIWNPTGSVDWPMVAIGLIALGLLFEGALPAEWGWRRRGPA